jgi:hypothetical protein
MVCLPSRLLFPTSLPAALRANLGAMIANRFCFRPRNGFKIFVGQYLNCEILTKVVRRNKP